MRKLLTCKHLLPFQTRAQPSSWLALFVLTLSLTAVWNRAQAATPQTAPPQLKNLLTQIDAAANQHDVKAVMQFYGENFSHSDGLSRQEKALTQLWQRYPNLSTRHNCNPGNRGECACGRNGYYYRRSV